MRDHNDGHYANHHYDDRLDRPHPPDHHDLHLDHDEHHHDHDLHLDHDDHHHDHDLLLHDHHHDHPDPHHHHHPDPHHHDPHPHHHPHHHPPPDHHPAPHHHTHPHHHHPHHYDHDYRHHRDGDHHHEHSGATHHDHADHDHHDAHVRNDDQLDTACGVRHPHGEPGLVKHKEECLSAVHQRHPAADGLARRAILQSPWQPPERAQLPVARSRDELRHSRRQLTRLQSPKDHPPSRIAAQRGRALVEGVSGGHQWHHLPVDQSGLIRRQTQSLRVLRRCDGVQQPH